MTDRPQPGEEWRTYHPTPFGPGALTTLARVVEVVEDIHRVSIVRYQQTYPTPVERVLELPLDAFARSHAGPREDEAEWAARTAPAPSDPGSGE